MGRFLQRVKDKEQQEKLSKHPLRNESEEIKKDYIQSLILLAYEDDNFSEEEREHIVFLLGLLDLDEGVLESCEQFVKDASDDALFDFIERLKNLDDSTKMQIVVEACVVAFKDNEVDENEQNIIDEYLNILSLEEHKDAILFLAKALNDAKVDDAIVAYLVYGDLYAQFEYMFDILGIDVQHEIRKLYRYQWTKWKTNSHSLEGEAVSTQCISTRQMSVMLNTMLRNGTILRDDTKTESFIYAQEVVSEESETSSTISPLGFRGGGIFGAIFGKSGECKVIKDVEASNLYYKDGMFGYEENVSFSGATVSGVSLFFHFVDVLYEKRLIEEKVSVVTIEYEGKFSYRINSDSLYIPEHREICRLKGYYSGYSSRKDVDGYYENGEYPYSTECSPEGEVQFRAMKPLHV